ncbi:MAG: ABC transporter ATP-binding protein [Desulfobacula sp.]|jgi:ABC-2 type transport system ATP-binding protein|nr:ABC transporter ATP-binding protein [Desulfobacula sp.]MBT7260870.1 ABC transporter ATP-binding protein [Desulfobacula sp.]
MAKIILKNISKSYRSDFKRKKIIAVNDVSLNINQGEIFGVIGVNGAGKSTIIKMIQGFIRPDHGEILVCDKKPSDPNSRLKMGYLPENPYFYDNLSVLELLQFSAAASGIQKHIAEKQIDHLLNIVDLHDVRKHKLRTFSKGMTQRAGICFALVHHPEIVILDEPMSGLDPPGRKMVIDLIKSLKEQGKTILFCSHILNDVERICDRVAVMDKGRLKKIFRSDEIVANSMEEIFLNIIQGK